MPRNSNITTFFAQKDKPSAKRSTSPISSTTSPWPKTVTRHNPMKSHDKTLSLARVSSSNGTSTPPEMIPKNNPTDSQTTMESSKSNQQSSSAYNSISSPSSSPLSFTPSPPPPNTSFQSTITQTSAILLDSREIRDSDQDSSTPDSDDSDSSLEDLFSILARRRALQNNLPVPPQLTPRKRTRNIRLDASPVTVRPKLKFDLKALMKSREDDKVLDEGIQALDSLRAREGVEEKDEPKGKTQEELLESVVAGTEESKKDKVFKAVLRTEALAENREWRFFKSKGEDDRVKREASEVVMNDFPKVELGKPLAVLRQTASREGAVLSGHVQDVVNLGYALPRELFLWILTQTYTQSREDLREAYASILLASSSQVRELLERQHVGAILGRLGGSVEAVDVEAPLQYETVDDNSYIRRDCGRLCTSIDMLGNLCTLASTDLCTYTLQLLLRLCADKIVLQSKGLFITIQRAITKASTVFSDDEWTHKCAEICKTIHDTIPYSPTLLQILQCIPTTTLRMHDLRRRISLFYLLQSPQYATSPVYNLDILDLFSDHLTQNRYIPTNATDYTSLAADLSILDIALDDGNFHHTTSTTSTTSISHTHSKSAPVDSPRIVSFNAKVDLLSEQLKAIHRAIRDNGVSHPSRTVAKTQLQAIYERIEGCVRRGAKRKAGVFDGAEELKEQEEERTKRQRMFMDKWVGKGRGKSGD